MSIKKENQIQHSLFIAAGYSKSNSKKHLENSKQKTSVTSVPELSKAKSRRAGMANYFLYLTNTKSVV